MEAALQKKLLSLIQQGKDVVIDFSFWSKENRNFYKELIQKAGAETELVYMKASKELLQKRLYKRNQDQKPKQRQLFLQDMQNNFHSHRQYLKYSLLDQDLEALLLLDGQLLCENHLIHPPLNNPKIQRSDSRS